MKPRWLFAKNRTYLAVVFVRPTEKVLNVSLSYNGETSLLFLPAGVKVCPSVEV